MYDVTNTMLNIIFFNAEEACMPQYYLMQHTCILMKVSIKIEPFVKMLNLFRYVTKVCALLKNSEKGLETKIGMLNAGMLYFLCNL